jgi:hypothetical protein
MATRTQTNIFPTKGEKVKVLTRVFETFISLEIEDVVFFLDFDQLRQIAETTQNQVDSHLEAVALAQFDAQRDNEYSLA